MAVQAATKTPTTAERIRSACARGTAAMVATDGLDPTPTPMIHLLCDGSVALTVPATGALASTVTTAGAAGVHAVLELTDYAPLALREPVRSLVWIQGRLWTIPDRDVPAMLDLIAASNPHPALLEVNSATDQDVLMRLDIESVVAADSTGAESIPVSSLLGARPDPFCTMEAAWLQHLEAQHRDVVDRLASRLPGALRNGHVRPLGLDRYGVALRVESADGDHDVRLPFPQPVDDVTGLSRAIRILMGCPFLNGLRARRI
ncbi:DUF2470 domain-containing protein [Mycolicibacterium sp. 018/SC-01/001]|uniref:DUF2470 domain-containing protein n=1 Tax=Mycolicibacterium sp. 018/SC-01/001 TaxID=2592069 RepID=UPI0011800AB0|nr:DUF2470 domain-containing protein [Mycolicibacterium sp. 018/SC-01/001]TRW88909.1 DUF2470 domain-containing protein [Mycolicibacterium sp. 018/SC-01/001]